MILEQKYARAGWRGWICFKLLVLQGEGCSKTNNLNSYYYEDKIIKLGWA